MLGAVHSSPAPPGWHERGEPTASSANAEEGAAPKSARFAHRKEGSMSNCFRWSHR